MGKVVLGVIGCGNMGSAIVKGIVDKHILSPKNICLNDKCAEKARSLSKKTACPVKNVFEMLKEADFLLIAIKPQEFSTFSKEISNAVRPGTTVISIMAGVSINTIVQKFGKKLPVARVMPNLGAIVSESMTCISYNGKVPRKSFIKNIFGSIGKVIEVKENKMDAVTALAGSGPAYLFYLADSMIEAAREHGFDKKASDELVIQTLYGASVILRHTAHRAGSLIHKVASKGGTTEEALKVFNEGGKRALIKKAIHQAKKRSKELSRG
ncbi:MAG: pyrroline-5-carboxylate reductase [Candidatus Omnitrophica bacterium]|nr:pyrroline-5-carboxylate reductase [Candidatus Omnitrophota bacterium]